VNREDVIPPIMESLKSPLQFSRGISASGQSDRLQQVWQLYVSQDEYPILQNSLASWIKNISSVDPAFKHRVYENEDMQGFDIRHHRAGLLALLADGELLAIQFLAYGFRSQRTEDAQAHVDFIDRKLKELFNTLIAWHGPLSAQADVPESFKQAVREVEQGKIVNADF